MIVERVAHLVIAVDGGSAELVDAVQRLRVQSQLPIEMLFHHRSDGVQVVVHISAYLVDERLAVHVFLHQSLAHGLPKRHAVSLYCGRRHGIVTQSRLNDVVAATHIKHRVAIETEHQGCAHREAVVLYIAAHIEVVALGLQHSLASRHSLKLIERMKAHKHLAARTRIEYQLTHLVGLSVAEHRH